MPDKVKAIVVFFASLPANKNSRCREKRERFSSSSPINQDRLALLVYETLSLHALRIAHRAKHADKSSPLPCLSGVHSFEDLLFFPYFALHGLASG